MSNTFEKCDIQLKNGNRAAMSTTADQVYHEETGMSAAAELSALQGSLATVETTSTASRAYAVGEYLVYTGVLYKVTVAIASGGTITPGTNCTAATVGDQLNTIQRDGYFSKGSFSADVPMQVIYGFGRAIYLAYAGTLTLTSCKVFEAAHGWVTGWTASSISKIGGMWKIMLNNNSGATIADGSVYLAHIEYTIS